jgi:hypothetical protein
MGKRNDADAARKIVADAERLVSEWPEWKQQQFERLSAGECLSSRKQCSDDETKSEPVAA